MRKCVIFLLILIALLISCVNVNAAIKSQTLTRSVTYYDSLIPSLNLGTVTGVISFSYDDCTNKLVNQKSVYITGTVIGATVTNKVANWDWYNTTYYNGSGRATLGWQLDICLIGEYIPIIPLASYFSQTDVYGNGTWVFHPEILS